MNLQVPDSVSWSSSNALPVELAMAILERVWNRSWTSRFDLRSCSLVCRTWRSMAQKLLFTEAIISNERHGQSFLSTIQHNPSLGSAVKLLDLRFDPLALYNPLSYKGTETALLYQITTHCPQLHHLKMRFPVHRFSESTKNLLYPRTLNTLQALDLRVDDSRLNSERNATVIDILHFLNQFTSLSHLRLADVGPLSFKGPANNLPPPPSFELYEFSWLDYSPWGSMGNDLSRVADWLFGNSTKGPMVFQLHDSDEFYNTETLSYFLTNYGQNLVSLSLSILPVHMAQLSLNLAEACPHLQELILPYATILSEILTHPNILLGITHLGLGEIRSDEDMAMTEKTIDWVNSLPNIRRVTLRVYPISSGDVSDHRVITSWKERCVEKVEIDWIETWDSLSITDDMIRAFRFPRGITVQTSPTCSNV
ncbi:hypothetical protein FRC02_000578 [Tulasnella sp. 418]|nr:hypothetical protein FRC02_000578 [Tulasnella sp. 418]